MKAILPAQGHVDVIFCSSSAAEVVSHVSKIALAAGQGNGWQAVKETGD